MPKLTSLNVIMPVYNEGDFVTSAVEKVATAARTAGIIAQIIIVDDGSTGHSSQVLEELEKRSDVTLIHQENQGRFIARQQGIAQATADYVLLLDGRVEVDEQSFVAIQEGIAKGKNVWNFAVELANPDSPWAAFWFGITNVWWRDYFMNPRDVVIDADNFDKYPKGTGAFFAPRKALIEAMSAFNTMFDDISLASDDTGMLRKLAQEQGIHLSPSVKCRYWGKDTPKKFIKQCYFRGTTFVDGYLGSSNKALPALGILSATGATGMTLAVKKPLLTAALGIAGTAGAGAIAKKCGSTIKEARAVSMLSIPFGVCFGAGVIRGLIMATRSKRDSL